MSQVASDDDDDDDGADEGAAMANAIELYVWGWIVWTRFFLFSTAIIAAKEASRVSIKLKASIKLYQGKWFLPAKFAI